MEPIKILIHGALGKVGQVLINSLCRESAVKLVGAVDARAESDLITLPDNLDTVPLGTDLASIIETCNPQVIIDFTIASATMPAVRIATERGVNVVVGTSGLTDADLKEIDSLARNNHVGVVVASNFALGAVLMMHMSKIASKYLDYAEIIELHHHQKVDAPSGTALSTAKAMAESRGKPFNQVSDKDNTMRSRGQVDDNIAIHSVRLPGFMAHQEVIFGGLGQTLSIRHDTVGRECYVPGVLLAIKEVISRQGLIFGLDALLGL